MNPLTFILGHRKAVAHIRKYIDIAKLDLEILSWFDVNNKVVSSYQTRMAFDSVNPQNVSKSIRHLRHLELLEVLYQGTGSKASILCLSKKGEELLGWYKKTIIKYQMLAMQS